jgi:predicted transcriptional regulator of viral defense system
MAAWLAVGKHIATVSHSTALHVQGLIDEAPAEVHVTIPRSRRSLTSTRAIRIHTVVSPLPKKDLTICDGLIVTTAERSILDSAEAGSSLAELRLAAARALQQGLVSEQDLLASSAERSHRVARQIQKALDGS